MGSSGSKATSSCSSSSSSGSFRKGRSKGHRGFPSYCLGTTSGSRDSDNDDQVCDQNKVNGRDVTYTSGNEIDSDGVKTGSFRKVKSDEMPCMPSNIELDEWGHTASRTGSSSAHASSTQSLNPSSRFLSRFSLIPGNLSFRLSRTTSLGSSRPCPISSANHSIFNNEDELNLHPGPPGSLMNRNETQQCSDLLNASFVNRVPVQYHEDASNNLSSNAPALGLSGNLQSSPTLSPIQDVVRDRYATREVPDVNLFSPRIHTETENVETRHTDRRNGAREPVERNVRFSRTLSVGRLRDTVLRRSSLSDFTFCPLQQDREVRDASQDSGRQVGERDTRVSPSDRNAVNSHPASGYPLPSMSSSLFNTQDYEVETSRPRETRYQDLLEHRSNFLERRRRIRSQVRALQRLGSRFENLSGHDRSCILSGQHRNGRCTCRISSRDNNSNDDTNARASISRIVMLAEALFEVLDEIHQQSVVLSSRPSVSSIGSVPAPNEVVESLPVKLYTKLHKHQEEPVQCYICLVEYEDGDSMRGSFAARSVESQLSAGSLRTSSVKETLENQPPVLRIDECLSPASIDSVVIAERDSKNGKYASASPINSVDCLEADQLMQDIHAGVHENDFTGTPYVPVYIKLPAGIINKFCQLIDPEGIRQELIHIKSLNIDGVIVDCWWGIVEGWNPQKYVWSGYRELFNIIREFKLNLQVVMAFHEYGGNDSSDALISLPQWVLDIGKDNQDIFFTDREGRRNTECLSWGIDKERVLKGRTGIEVYFDMMRSFRTEFDDLFAEGLISAVEIGLGASGELKYPSFSERMGWRYPGIGEFQCYDKYLQHSLRRAAKLRGHSFWARGPDNAGHYNSMPHETGFFCERGDYDNYYGRFFLHWYSQTLIDHADNVLSLASLAFEETKIIVKVPAVYWWYKTPSHAAELTAGYHNPTNQDGYSPVFEVLKKHAVTMKFVCLGFHLSSQEANESLVDPEGLSWQVLNSAWDRGLIAAGENALLCYDREGYRRLVEMAKPRNDPDHRHFSFFVYQQPSLLQGNVCLSELDFFIKCMHGKDPSSSLASSYGYEVPMQRRNILDQSFHKLSKARG
ncbi:Glycoside hydrolase, family 14 [Sesbania bispinosa]|nr:Glycoside hydrolase, family 14 [Sesbania bispinosa]